MARVRVVAAFAVLALVAAPVAASASSQCDALPRSALRTRPCNPRAECLAAIAKDVKGPAREARQGECERLPASGVCHGPDRYDPQAECRQQRRK